MFHRPLRLSFILDASPLKELTPLTDQRPQVSVVIPTHNRSSSLRRTLDALVHQDYPIGQIEVVVVADGCTDDTAEMLLKYEAPFPVRILEQPCRGPAAARNAGASVADGELLVFLDDDVEPLPGLIEAHVQAHENVPRAALVGPYPPMLNGRSDFFNTELRHWWETMFDTMGEPGHRHTFRDLLTGNFSIEKVLFGEMGMFDTDLRCHEDYEFGVRLIKAGVTLIFAPKALAYHHETTDLDRALERKYEEGKADVLMGRRHPELRPILLLSVLRNHRSSSNRLLCALAFRSPGLARKLLVWLKTPLGFLEKFRIRRYWGRILYFILDCSYWVGVKEQLGTIQALDDFLEGHLDSSTEKDSIIELDLHEGIGTAERKLDQKRPAGAVIHYGNQLVGRILPQPGSEPLRGAHLRPVLATKLARPLAKALVQEGVMDLHVDAERLLAACELESVKPELFDATL